MAVAGRVAAAAAAVPSPVAERARIRWSASEAVASKRGGGSWKGGDGGRLGRMF